jgi:competence protein ComGC
MTDRHRAFTLVEVVGVVLVVGLLAFVGLRVWGSYTSKELANNTPTDTVRQVTTTADVNAVEKQLDTVDVVGSFEQELDAETSF